MLYSGVSQLVVTHLQHEARNRIEPAFPPSSLLSSSSAFASTAGSNSAGTNLDTTIPRARPELGQDRIAQSFEGETFLNAIKGTWEDHKVCMGKLRDVLKYMVSIRCVGIIQLSSLTPQYEGQSAHGA